MYKVFVNENVIILTNKIPFGSKINLFDIKKISLIDIVSNVKKHKKIFLFHKNSEKLILNFKKKIKVIFAGGGIVKNNLDETLFIYRRNKWDLPKGMPAIKLIIGEKNSPSSIVLNSSESKIIFSLTAKIKKIDNNNCSFELEFNGDLNPMIQMMVKSPLQSFINDLSNNTSKLV